MLKDSRSYETQLIDAVRSVNRALGGTYGTSSAIYKNEFNQYEVQLIDAIKGIGRTLSGKGLSGIGGFGGGASEEALQDLARRVTKLENESFFRLVDGNITLKEQYQNLWVPGWLAAGGVGSGGGGGGSSTLSGLDDVSIDTTTLADGHVLTWDADGGPNGEGIWVNSPSSGGGGGGSSVSVQSLAASSDNVSKIAKITIDGTDTYLYNDVKWGTYDSSNYTIPVTINGETRTLCVNGYSSGGGGSVTGYIGTTQVQSSSSAQPLTGILSVKATSATSSLMEWDSTNNAWHFYGNMYADGWVSAGGVGSGGSSGGSVVTISNLLSSGTRIATLTIDGTDYNILAPSGGGSGSVTSVAMTVPTGLSVSGTPITSSGTLAVSLASGYVIPQQSTLDNFVTLNGTQTITGAKTFTTNPVTIGSTSGLSVNASSYIEIGNARLVYDSTSNALHLTKTSGTSGTVGLYADGFIASGGTGGSSNVPDELNYAGRLYIQRNSYDLCLTSAGHTIIGSYPGSSDVGSNKLYVAGNACFAGIVDTGYSSGHIVSVQDIVDRIVALENA